MKKLAVILLSVIAAVIVLSGFSGGSPQPGTYVYDVGDYLTAEEEQAIQNRILEVRDKVKADFVVYYTANPVSDNADAAADQALQEFVAAGGGYGDNHETIIFYTDMKNRRMALHEKNEKGKYLIKDSEIDSIIGDESAVKSYLGNGDYYRASMQFVEDAAGAAKPGFFGTIWGWLTPGLAGGGAISGILVGRHKRQPRTPKTSYRKANGTVPLRAQDRFLGTTTEVRHIERQQPREDQGQVESHSTSDTTHGGSNSF